MGEDVWERARLIPVSSITGPDEQECPGSSALLAVIESVKEFGRALAAPLGAPAGAITTYIVADSVVWLGDVERFDTISG